MADTTDKAAAKPAPRRKDELDPELMSLRKTRAPVGAITSAAIVAFCVFMMIKLRADLSFSRQAATPRGTAAAELLDGRIAENALVSVSLVPDRSVAILIQESEADYGVRATPVQGTDGRIWVMVDGSSWSGEVAYNEVYVGRVRRLGDLTFHDALARELATRGATPRFFTTDALLAAVSAGQSTIKDPTGEQVALAANQVVEFDVGVANRAAVEVVSTDRHRTAEDWKAALIEAGLVDASATPTQAGEGAWTFQISGQEAVTRTTEKLETLRLLSARVVPVTERVATTFAELKVAGAGLVTNGRTITAADAAWVNLPMPRTARADAVVIDTTDKPEHYWYVLPLFLMLAAFALLFAWALIRAVLADRRPAAPGVAVS